ncbi:hypothetical protein DFP72DRAFT_1163659 [Ephemerocybe angulata]|uniref:F-box domain-containing protein n=1 Tax=Ephemerocybe angulata TaxID=980116 RepID=A0A8H6IDU6_9AGAR|nr:hypothetical protein DFP72DRAFT_1163659 [Tulosesus angulatus]
MQSPFESILHTNHIPTEEQCKAIEDFLEFPEKQLVEVDSKITEVDLQLRELQNKRDSLEWVASPLRRAVKAHRAIISLARRLPDDVYREIFPYCLPTESYATPNPLDAPIVLTHVCRRWRHIAHSTPRLWSRLHMDPLAIPEYDEDSDAPTFPTREWIQRAAAVPFSLSFHSASPYFPPVSAVRELIEGLALSSTTPRWNNFAISLPSADVLKILALPYLQGATTNPFWNAQSVVVAMQRLADFSLNHSVDPHPLVAILAKLDLKRNKQLRELTFVHNGYDRNLLHDFTPFLPCLQLEMLDLQDPNYTSRSYSMASLPPPMAYEILKCCRNLVVFKMDACQFEPSLDEIPPERYGMDRLKELSISLYDLNEVTDIAWFSNFDFPALTCLHLRSRSMNGPGSQSGTLAHVLKQVRHNLTSLVLDPGYLEQKHLIKILRALPSLVQLHLKSAYFANDFEESMEEEYKEVAKWTDEVLKCLTPQDDQDRPHACPRLQYLKWQYNTCFTEAELLKFLYQRSSHPSSLVPLKQVRIDFGRLRTNHWWELECRELVEAGLDLRVTYLDPEVDPIYFEEKNLFYRTEQSTEEEARVELPIIEKSGYLDFGWE